jgi:hypothetical protein
MCLLLTSRALQELIHPGNPLGEESDGFGVLPQTVDDVLTECAAAAGIIADGSAAEGDQADRASAHGQGTDREATGPEKDSDRAAAETDTTEGGASDGNEPAREAAHRQHAGRNVSNCNHAARVPANFTAVGIGADGNVVQRHAPQEAIRAFANAAPPESAPEVSHLVLERINPCAKLVFGAHLWMDGSK